MIVGLRRSYSSLLLGVVAFGCGTDANGISGDEEQVDVIEQQNRSADACRTSAVPGSRCGPNLPTALVRHPKHPRIVVSPSHGVTTEAGGQVALAVRLTSAPRSDVTLIARSDTPSEGRVAPSSLTFTADNWNVPQMVTVTGASDVVPDGNRQYTVTLSPLSPNAGPGRSVATVRLVNRDVPFAVEGLGVVSPAFQDSTHRFVAGDGSFFVYAAYPPEVMFENGFPSTPGQLWLYDRATGDNQLISRDPIGGYGNGGVAQPAVSGNGRYIAFVSAATNLVPGVDELSENVFLYDRETGRMELISQTESGQSLEAFAHVSSPTLSDDGRFVSFATNSGRIVGQTEYKNIDFFVRDRATGQTRLIADASGTVPSDAYRTDPVISGNGRFLAFIAGTASDPHSGKAAYVQDLATGALERVDVNSAREPGESFVFSIDITDDGRHVTFAAFGTNLVPETVSPFSTQVYVRDRASGTTELASVNSAGVPGDGSSNEPRLSADGRFVAFISWAPNMSTDPVPDGHSDVYVHDRVSGVTSPISVALTNTSNGGWSDSFALSSDGGTLVFEAHLVPEGIPTLSGLPSNVFIAAVPRR